MNGLLNGVRVLEFGMAWAGPLAARLMGDLGADVIKIERRDARGAGRGWGSQDTAEAERSAWQWGKLPGPTFRSGIFPDADPGQHPWNRAGIFNKMNRNKRSLCVDLKVPAGWKVFELLVRSADVLLDNLSPLGVDGLGIDAARMQLLNPRLIRVSMSGFGATGPDRNNVSYGPVVEGASGLASATGYEGGEPMKMGVAFPDPVGGLHGAFAVLAALWERERTGVGTAIDLSQLETYTSIAGELLLQTSVEGRPPPTRGNRSRRFAPQGVYRCAGENSWIAITVRSDKEWIAFVEETGVAALSSREYASLEGRRVAHDEIDAAIGSWTSGFEQGELAERMQRQGIAVSPVLTNKGVVEDPHLRERGFIVEWDQPEVGSRTYGGFPIEFSDRDRPQMCPAPGLGEHNREILEELGFDAQAVDQMERDGVIATSPTGP
ncbi:MAG TPA: CoA transferase [Dehalococcoidia bacterium]|nr:CoA transferase [Dehalococcoidia bacterium]